MTSARQGQVRSRRRWLLAGVVLLAVAWTATAHASRIQYCTGSTNTASAYNVSCTWPSATTSGNALFAVLVESSNSGFINPSTDGSGWNMANAQKDSSYLHIRIYYNLNASPRSGTITWNFGTATNASIYMVEYSNILTANAQDQSNNSTGNSNSAMTGTTSTLGSTTEVAIAGVAVQNSGYSFSGESFTEVAEKNSTDGTYGLNAAFLEYFTSSTSGVGTSASISGSANWVGIVQMFKASAGGGGGGGTTGTWIGAQTGHLWSNAANWANSTLPGVNDTVVLNSTGNNAMVIDQDVSVAGFSVNSGYTNSITQSGTHDMTIAGDLTLAAASGTFTAPAGLLQIGGSFSKTGAITFTHNSGTVMLTSTAAESLATGGATFKDLIINDGLIGYWALDESTIGTAVDSSGYGNDATQHNTPAASTTVPGVDFRDPYSVSFTGTNGNNSTTRYLATGTMPAVLKPTVVTMSAWYRATGVASQGGEIVSGSNRYALRVYNSTQIKVTKQTASGSWIELAATVSGPLDGNWHHIAGVINGSGMIAYFDGAQVASNSDTAAIFYGTSGNTAVNGGAVGYLNIGRNQDTSNYEFTGNIDEVRLYNRTLSATEISSLGKGRQPGTGSGVYTMTGTPTIAGDLTIASGTLAAGANNLTVSGDWWNYGGLYTSSGNTVTMNGSGTNYIRSAGQVFSNLTFSGAGSAILADRTEIDPGGLLAVTAGTFDLSSYTLRAGNVTRSGSATFTPSTSTVVLDGTSNRTVTAGTFKNLRVESSPATELAGYWKMDKGQGKTVMDYSGNNHTGTLANTPTWIDTGLPSPITFENNAALSFDGASDYVDLGTNVVTTNAAFTVCTWVNMASLSSNGGYHYFVSKSNNTGATFYLARRGDTTKFAFMMPSTDGGVTTRTDGTTVPSAGTWYHLCGVYDTTHLYVYVNGVSEGTPAAFSSGINSTGSTIIGAGKVSGALSDYVNGSMDDVRIYSKALSGAQIAALASGTYPPGLTGAPTYTLGASTTVSGTFALDSGTFSTGTGYTMNNSNTSAAALVNAGTYVVGNSASTFSGGLNVTGNGALTMATSGGALKIGSTKPLTIDGTFTASSTGATIQTAGSAGTYYSFQVGSTSGAAPVLNITGLTVKNTDTSGMNINANTAATTTFTRFDNIAFSGGTGTQLLKIYAPTLYLDSNGCTFDAGTTASTTYNVSLTGDGSATETRIMFGGATCASNKASCEAYDNDNDSNGDGVGDTPATNGAVIQWAAAAQADTNGTIEGFPTAAFDWNTFTYYATYVTFHDVDSGTADRIYVRDTNGDPQYSWDGPSGTDFVGAPRFDTVSSVHYVYVATASGKVYRLIDNGSSLAQDNTGNWAGANNPYSCSCTITTPLTLDSTNLYWGGVLTAGSLNKVWTLGKTSRAQAGGTPLTTTALVSGAAPALWASGDTYLFVGETTHFDKLDVTTQSLTTTNASPSGTVNGRITVINSKLFGVDTSGKLWVLNPATSGLPTLWSYHDNTNHNGCTSGVCAVTGSLYVDPATNRAFYGDSDGHLYASYNSSGTTGAQMTGFPYRPGNSSEVYASAPFYNSGVLVVGTTTGSVYVIDINGGSGPVLLQTYKLGPATNISGVAYDKSGGNYMISAADATAKDGNIIYIPAVADPTPGSN